MSGYELLQTLISDQLAEERARKQSLEQRGLAVITSSGTMVTLLFALAALVTNDDDFVISGSSKFLLAGAATSFSVAAVLAIFIQKPLLYQEPGIRWLRTVTSASVWDTVSATTASRRAAEARVNSIESFRQKNLQKVRLLTAALSFEAAAIAFVVGTVATIFF